MNDLSLPPQHGFPLRLVVPGWYGMTNVKWLDRITVLDEPFTGYQQRLGYRFRLDAEEEGTPLSRMQPRALMVPPGIPEFLTRERTVPAGHCRLEGRAWSGWTPIERVEVGADGGSTWADAELADDPPERWAWRAWRYDWRAEPGALIHHYATKSSDEFVIFDVWQSREDFERFSNEKLRPALEKVAGGNAAAEGEPTFGELHNEFTGGS